MGLFKRKPDPISERARALNAEIAPLEAKIKNLSAKEWDAGPPSEIVTGQSQPPALVPAVVPSQTLPRLRSTAFPHHRHTVLARPASGAAAAAPAQPVEEVEQNHYDSRPDPVPVESEQELGVRKYDLASFWQRLKNHFRGPPTSNPKLVNYLAAGSIQGLRPLRSERRVARNRFIVLVLCLVLVLWGLIAFLMRHR